MVSNAARFIARMLWILPAVLLFLTLHQAKVALDLRATWQQGTSAVAEVLHYENSNRVDVTYGYVSLRVSLARERRCRGTSCVRPASPFPGPASSG